MRARTALTKLVGVKSFETAFFSDLIYDGRTLLRDVIVSRSDCFSSVSQRTSLDGMGQPVKTEAKVDEAARERSAAVDCALRLSASQFYSHLHTLIGKSSLYTLGDDKCFEKKR